MSYTHVKYRRVYYNDFNDLTFRHLTPAMHVAF